MKSRLMSSLTRLCHLKESLALLHIVCTGETCLEVCSSAVLRIIYRMVMPNRTKSTSKSQLCCRCWGIKVEDGLGRVPFKELQRRRYICVVTPLPLDWSRNWPKKWEKRWRWKSMRDFCPWRWNHSYKASITVKSLQRQCPPYSLTDRFLAQIWKVNCFQIQHAWSCNWIAARSM